MFFSHIILDKNKEIRIKFVIRTNETSFIFIIVGAKQQQKLWQITIFTDKSENNYYKNSVLVIILNLRN